MFWNPQFFKPPGYQSTGFAPLAERKRKAKLGGFSSHTKFHTTLVIPISLDLYTVKKTGIPLCLFVTYDVNISPSAVGATFPNVPMGIISSLESGLNTEKWEEMW